MDHPTLETPKNTRLTHVDSGAAVRVIKAIADGLEVKISHDAKGVILIKGLKKWHIDDGEM